MRRRRTATVATPTKPVSLTVNAARTMLAHGGLFRSSAKKGCDTTPEQKRLNRLLAELRAVVEHPFRVLKRQFGFGKVRYRGLFKNEQHLFAQFALVNLYLARRLMAPTG